VEAIANLTGPEGDPPSPDMSQGYSAAELLAQVQSPTVIHNYDLRGTDLSKSNNAFGSSDFSQTSTTRSGDVWPGPLAALAELVVDGDLPRIADLNPYRLGATASAFGNSQDYGRQDPYVPRLGNDVDHRLFKALDGSDLVLLVGPSKAGKTRTCFEAILKHSPHARLLAPLPGMFARLVEHPRVQDSDDAVVVWLDDLDRFLTHSSSLTPALLARLTNRSGRTIAIATLRSEARARLREATGELTRDARLLLEQARTIHLASTSSDPSEQSLAAAIYPNQDIRHGLAEGLAGAPRLLEGHDDALHTNPVLHAVVEAVVDWARAGRADPIPEQTLIAVVIDSLQHTRLDLEVTEKQAQNAISQARTPQFGAGRVAALTTHQLHVDQRGYRPFDYLVASADGQDRPPRPIPERMWRWVLHEADVDVAADVGIAADLRGNRSVATRAFRRAIVGGSRGWVPTLVYLFETRGSYDLPGPRGTTVTGDDSIIQQGFPTRDTASELESLRFAVELAQGWNTEQLACALDEFEQKALSGEPGAMVALGILLSERCDPPNLATARHWYETAAAKGDLIAVSKLGELPRRVDSTDLAGAEQRARKARDARQTAEGL
jgi:hypothetical protein